MVPSFEKFLYPFLLTLKTKDVNKKQMVEEMRRIFSLSDEDMNVRTKNGTTTRVVDRVGWALQYLRRALFVEIKDGKYHITKRGLDYLAQHKDLLIIDLLEYKEFAEYSNRKKTQHKDNPSKDLAISLEQTPTEQLEHAFESIENDLIEDVLEKVKHQSPVFFEHLVVDLLVKMGYGGSFETSAKVTHYTNDNGIDGIIYEDKLGLDKIYVQAKRWENQVSRPKIQEFAGALVGQNANKGVFITTSTYSKEAREYVKGIQQKIVLIDGRELASYMIEYNVGVSTNKIYEIKKIDNDYFEELY
mgnify:CR=1 FL=1